MVQDGNYQGAMFFQEYGIAAAYHPDLVEIVAIEDLSAWNFGVNAYIKPVQLTDTGGVTLDWALA